jgi:hypothetical protein
MEKALEENTLSFKFTSFNKVPAPPCGSEMRAAKALRPCNLTPSLLLAIQLAQRMARRMAL